jgi:hypothetical protein
MASRARNRRRFKSSTSRLTMQSYAIQPTATPILSAAHLRANDRERGGGTEAAFAGIWIGDRAITRVAYQDLFASAFRTLVRIG